MGVQRQQEKGGKRWTHHKIVRLSGRKDRNRGMAVVVATIDREGWECGTSSAVRAKVEKQEVREEL